MSLYATAVKKPITTALCFVAIVVIGLFSLTRLSIDLYPKIETNSIMVMTTYNGASASDIETNVTKIMENTLNTVSDLKRITSQSKENISIVTLEFEYGTDIAVATNDIRDKLGMVSNQLPDNAQNPIIFKFGADDIPVVMISVTADESLKALSKIIDDKVANPLKRISGVGAVSVSGIPKREIQIYTDPQKLEAYNLSIEAISNIIAAENRNTPGGNMDFGNNTYSLRVEGEFKDPNEMLDIVVGQSNGRSIYLRDIARIVDGPEERAEESFLSGRDGDGNAFISRAGGVLMIQKQSGANSVNISRQVLKKLPEIQRSLPSDVKLGLITNTSTNIENTISSLQDTIVVTFVIVMLVVLVFLGRWRATFIIILTIPISLIASFAYLLISGNTLNIISLSSLSIAIGMVVDDAIVVLENITNHIERGSDPKQAAIHATNEVAVSVIASTLTMLAVFLPMTMVPGMAGILFRQLGWIVSIIMIVSTVGALTLTPMLSSQFLVVNPKRGKIFNLIFVPIEKFLDGLDNLYERSLRWVVANRKSTITVAMLIFFASVPLIKLIPLEFFPTMDNGMFQIKVELPIGTRTEVARDLGKRIEQEMVAKYPEIKASSMSTGQAGDDNLFGQLSANGTNIVSWYVNLTSVGERDRGLIEIADLVRKDLEKYPEIKTFKVIVGQGEGVGGQSAVDLEIYGFSFDDTDAVALQMMEKIKQVKGVSIINSSREDYAPEYQVEFDREKLALNGLNLSTASQYLRNRINGSIASFYRENGDEYNIRIRYAPENRQSIEDLENILIYNPQGLGIRVRDLGRVVERFTPPTIERKNRERLITVKAYIGPDGVLGDVATDIQKLINEADVPAGIDMQIAGSFEEMQESFSDLGLLGIMIILLVFIVLAAQFESLIDPLIIMFSLPFAMTGVFIGLAITKTPLGIMAMIGLIMLSGIVVKNAIVLIDYTILNRERGMTVRRAVIDAGRSRLRPVLMTTLTTVLGMIPLAIGQGEGSEMWRSMGMTVAWGLAFSTVITLIIVPTLYCVFAKNGIARRRKAHAKQLAKG